MNAERNQTAKVIVYTLNYCPYCRAVKDLLTKKGIVFEEIDFGGNDILRAEIAKKSGQQTAPQVFVDAVPIGGYEEVKRLVERGKLDKLVYKMG